MGSFESCRELSNVYLKSTQVVENGIYRFDIPKISLAAESTMMSSVCTRYARLDYQVCTTRRDSTREKNAEPFS